MRVYSRSAGCYGIGTEVRTSRGPELVTRIEAMRNAYIILVGTRCRKHM